MKPISLAQRVRPVVNPQKTLGETFDEMLGFSPLLGDFLRLGGHGLGSWVGIYVGIYAKANWMRAMGWVIGIGQGLTGICDVVSIVQRLVKPAPTTTEIQVSGKAKPRPWSLVP